MNGWQLASRAAVAAGVLVCVASALGAVACRDLLDRLHFVTPVTSLGTPLVGLGLAVDLGRHLAAALVVLTVAVAALAGPVLNAAIGQAVAEQRGLVPRGSPE
ncbi:monovalent cation/H(+) antiporter subunit G [Micromonospora sp. NPDC049559]|uniref:monovalent cation/H(+) antiporter subunit G n=1 Tax=Micromonospora sp. NPDC049559 TaxID=3155923 RepID=UPI00342F1CD6